MRRTLNIGRLNKKITFKKLTESSDDMGQSVQTLTTVKTVWASFYPMRGGETYELQKLQGKTFYRCYCRYFEGLDSNCYIVYDGKEYHIQVILDVDLQHKMYEITCVEYVNKEDM